MQVGVYLPLYDYLMGHMGSLGWSAPLVAGASSRTAAVLCTSPLELLRTRAQVCLEPAAVHSTASPAGPAPAHAQGLEGAQQQTWTGHAADP